MNVKDIVRFVSVANMLQKGGFLMAQINMETILNEEQKKQKEKVLNEIKGLADSFKIENIKEKEDYNPNLIKLDLKEVNQDNMENSAKDSLSYYEVKGKQDIENKYNNDIQKTQSEIDNLQNGLQLKQEDVKKKSAVLKENLKNKFINNNIYRSTIYEKFMSQIEKDEIDDLEKLKSETDAKIENLNGKLATLDSEKQNALEIFDIAYAVKLQEQIDKINKEINNYNMSAIKYNNQIQEKEEILKQKYEKQYLDYIKDAEDRNKKVMEFVQKYGYSAIQDKLNRQKYDMVLNYLNTMDKQTAYEILTENDDFKNELGINYYNKLIDIINNRKV